MEPAILTCQFNNNFLFQAAFNQFSYQDNSTLGSSLASSLNSLGVAEEGWVPAWLGIRLK